MELERQQQAMIDMFFDDTLDENIVESEIELDNSDVVEPDYDPPQQMGDLSVEVTEENQEAAQLSKSKATDAIFEGQLNEAIDHLTEAIILNPKSAILYASRATIFVKLKKPNAAIRDAEAALRINLDLAKGYKTQGMARALLGIWKEAARDLLVASKLDFDEETTMVLKKEAEFASVLKDGQVIEIDSASDLGSKLNAASELSRLAILYFTATWCGPCRYIYLIYASLAAKYPKVVFLKVDIDEVVEAAAEWKVSSIPSFFFAKTGILVDTVVEIDIRLLEQKIS